MHSTSPQELLQSQVCVGCELSGAILETNNAASLNPLCKSAGQVRLAPSASDGGSPSAGWSARRRPGPPPPRGDGDRGADSRSGADGGGLCQPGEAGSTRHGFAPCEAGMVSTSKTATGSLITAESVLF